MLPFCRLCVPGFLKSGNENAKSRVLSGFVRFFNEAGRAWLPEETHKKRKMPSVGRHLPLRLSIKW